MKTASIKKNLNYFRFKKNDDDTYLLTNDFGKYCILSSEEFNMLKTDVDNLPESLNKKLAARDFFYSPKNSEKLIKKYKKKNSFVFEGPSLHIFVVTLRCDHNCIYCHACRKNINEKKYDMTNEIAEKAVDLALQSSSNNLSFEFQGGEPLLNIKVIKHIIEYTKKVNKSKKVTFTIVTNLNLMTDEILYYFDTSNVRICTSLDGGRSIHNKNRILKHNDSFENATKWINRINNLNRQKEEKKGKMNRLNALMTVTRESLSSYKEIIDTYIEFGFNSIHLRPLNPFGFAKKLKQSLLYTPEEFIEFYKKSMDYIIELNNKGIDFSERMAKIILIKIIKNTDPNYLDLRSPCGAGIGQLSYNYDGKIFTCDEGRMVYEMGDDIFLLGDVQSATYSDIMQHDTVKSLCSASCLEGSPECHDCVYNPYCGLCPVYNFIEQGNIIGYMPANDRCKILKGIYGVLFTLLEDENAVKIFNKWLKIK
ncbi:MAG: His-Xaa-Ser system radical SAM maturase HxsB [Spirochaetes bacterium]|nr:His-Xaa-Ser system radical SAM maturase HxsB [Spirochaetota bacterium]